MFLALTSYGGISTAPCYGNGAVLRSYGACPSVCLSVRPSLTLMIPGNIC